MSRKFQTPVGLVQVTTAQRDAIPSPQAGDEVWNTTTGKVNVYSGTSWVEVGSGGGHTVQDEGVSLTQRTKINFIGAAVTATDNSGADSTDVTISGQTDKREAYTAGTPSGNYTGSLTVFDIMDTYTTGGKDLMVYVNGILQRVTDNYIETDNNTVTFLTALTAGDTVDFAWTTGTVAATDADTVDGFHASATPTANTLLPLDSNAQVSAAALQRALQMAMLAF